MRAAPRRFVVAAALVLGPGGTALAGSFVGPPDLAGLDRQVDGILTKHGVPGGALAVVRKGSVPWTHVFGKADVATDRAMTAGSLFPMGSVSKSVVAVALMQLVEAGRVSLDQPLLPLVPELRIVNPWEETHPLTLAHVLEHASGIQDLWPRWLANVGDELPPVSELARTELTGRELRYPPGHHYIYAQSNYLLAGYLLEKLTGEPFASYVEKHVLAPLGMRDSAFRVVDPARVVTGYVGPPLRATEPRQVVNRPAGGLTSSLADMIAFTQMHLRGGAPLLSAAAMTRIESERSTFTAKFLERGYGLGNWTLPTGHGIFHGHGGGIGGACVGFIYDRETDLGGVVMLNLQYAAEAIAASGEVAKAMRETFLGPEPAVETARDNAGLSLAAAAPRGRESAVAPPDVLAEAEGFYTLLNASVRPSGATFELMSGATVRADAGRLVVTPLIGKAQTLISAHDRVLHVDGEPGIAAVFGSDPQGHDYLRVGEQFYVKGTAASVWAKPLLLFAGALLMTAFGAHGCLTLLRRRRLAHGTPWTLAAVLASGVMLASFAWVQMVCTLSELTSVNAVTVTFFASSVIFTGATVVALIFEGQRFVIGRTRLFGLVTTIACAAFVAHLWSYGVIGLRLWGA